MACVKTQQVLTTTPGLLKTIRHRPGGDVPGVSENRADADRLPVS